jgi:Nif-specific regulatory protein
MPKLITTEGPDAGRTWPLDGPNVVVGRGEGCGVQLTDLTVSRQHFRLVPVGEGAWRLLDLGSRNRTVVNNEPVTEHSLADGDLIIVGATKLLFEDEPGSESALEVLPVGLETVTMEFAGMADALGQAAQLAGLYRFAQSVAITERLEDLHLAVVRVARSECSADRAWLFVLDRAGQLGLAARDITGGAPGDDRVTVSRTVLDKVLREGKSVGCSDTAGDAGLSVQDSIVKHAIRSVLCAPVVSRNRVVGVLYADIRRPGQTFRPQDLQFLTCIAQQAGSAIDHFTLRDALRVENERLRTEVAARHNLIGQGAGIQAVLRFVQKVGPTDSTVMINGESGTGKELVAHAIHQHSRRAAGPCVAINCAALTESLLESELFGHEKGAFTGAAQQKKGRFELADGGSLFLDEVGELPLSCQTKFLRVLEESCFERVGGGRTVRVDVRVIAATNRDLQTLVDEGKFRADLFYRLQVIQIELPPLRDRPEDIPLLVQHFIQRYGERMGRRIEGVTPGAIDALTRHPWPGNVRELKNAIERALVLGDGPYLRLEDLPPSLGGQPAAQPRSAVVSAPPRAVPAVGSVGSAGPPVVQSLRELEKQGIAAALQATGGNKLKAAELLEIDRSTLYKKIKDYGLEG